MANPTSVPVDEELVQEEIDLKSLLQEVGKEYLQQCDDIRKMQDAVEKLNKKMEYRDVFAKAAMEKLKLVNEEKVKIEEELAKCQEENKKLRNENKKVKAALNRKSISKASSHQKQLSKDPRKKLFHPVSLHTAKQYLSKKEQTEKTTQKESGSTKNDHKM